MKPVYKIAVIPGDGIGVEVIAEALKVARAAGAELDTTDYDLGGRRYLATGEVLPDSVLDELRTFDAILLGAVGTPEVPPGVLERGLLLRMRFELDLYINLRPFVAAGQRRRRRAHRLRRDPGEHRGHLRRRGRVPAQGHAGRDRHPGLGQHPLRRGALRPLRLRSGPVAAAAPPDPGAQDQCADLLRRPVAAHLRPGGARVPRRDDRPTTTSMPPASTASSQPQRYDVIVTDNLFGDILTDLGGAIAGGIGRAASGNLNPARTGPSMFEPVHGSAPDIAGTGQADPTAAIISTAMMLDFLGEADAAAPDHQSGRRASRRPTLSTSSRRRRSATPSQKGCRPMPITKTEKIWMDGELVDWDDAQHPHPDPHPALRLRRVRGHPGLSDRTPARPCSA